MNQNPPPNGRRWKWFWALLFVFLAHAAAVFWFGARVQPLARPEQPQPLLYIATDAAASRRLAEVAGTDPTVFALPSERGFSGGAWLTLKRSDLALTNWTAPAAALPLDVAVLGSALQRYAETNSVSAEALLDGLPSATPFELRVPSAAVIAFSTFAIEGALATRPLTSAAPLPVATNAELVTNSIVELSVNGDGVVESARLAGECGLRAMDEAALRAARQFAFEPLPLPRMARERAVPQRGRAVFTWRVVAPALTNSLTATAP